MMPYFGASSMSFPGMGFRFGGGSSLAHAHQVASQNPNKVTQFSGQNLGRADVTGVQKLLQKSQSQTPLQTAPSQTLTPNQVGPAKMAVDECVIEALIGLGDFLKRGMLGQLNIQSPQQQQQMAAATSGGMPPPSPQQIQPPMAPTSGMQQPGSGSPMPMQPPVQGQPLMPTTMPQGVPPQQEPPLPRTMEQMPNVVDQLTADKAMSKETDGLGELKADLQGFGAEKLGEDLIQAPPTTGDRLGGLFRGGTLGATMGGLLGLARSPFMSGKTTENVGRHFLSGGATGLGAVGGAQLGSRYGGIGTIGGALGGGLLANVLARKLMGKKKEEKKASDEETYGRYFCPKCGSDESYGGDRKTGTKYRGTIQCEPCGHQFSYKDAKQVPHQNKIALSLDLLRRAFTAAAGQGGKRLQRFTGKAEPYLNSTVVQNGTRMPRLQVGQQQVMSKMAPRQAVQNYTNTYQDFQNQVGSVNQGFNLLGTLRQAGNKLTPEQKRMVIANAMKGKSTSFRELGLPIPKEVANAKTDVIPSLMTPQVKWNPAVQPPPVQKPNFNAIVPNSPEAMQLGAFARQVRGGSTGSPPPIPQNMQPPKPVPLPQAPNLKFGMLKESITAKLVGNTMRNAMQRGVAPERLAQFQNRIGSWAPMKNQQVTKQVNALNGPEINPIRNAQGLVDPAFAKKLHSAFGTSHKNQIYVNPGEVNPQYSANIVKSDAGLNTLMHEMGHASRQALDRNLLSSITKAPGVRQLYQQQTPELGSLVGREKILQEWLANRAVTNRLPKLQTQFGLDPKQWKAFTGPQMESYRLGELNSINGMMNPGKQQLLQSFLPLMTKRQQSLGNNYLDYLKRQAPVAPSNPVLPTEKPNLNSLGGLKALFGKQSALLNTGGMERSTTGDGTKKFVDAGPATYGNQAWKDSEKWMRSDAKAKTKAKMLLETKEATDLGVESEGPIERRTDGKLFVKHAWVGGLIRGAERLGAGGAKTWEAVANPLGKAITNPNVMPAVVGGLGGGMYGDDMGVGKVPGALAGIAAFNPRLNRLTHGGFSSSPMQAVRTGIVGNMAGGALDVSGGLTGLTDGSNRFARLGGQLGTGIGATRGLAGGLQSRMLAKGTMTPEVQRALGGVLRQTGNARTGMNNFAFGAFGDPLAGLGKGVVRGVSNLAGVQAPSWAAKSMMIPTNMRTAGRIVGGAGLAGFGVGTAGGMIGERLDDLANRKFEDFYRAGRDQMAVDIPAMMGFGQGGSIDQVTSKFDNLLMGLGLDPSRMSPGKKLAILGGGGAGALGLLTGNPTMMAGGLGTLALSRPQQFLPYATPPETQMSQMNMPQGRNELQLQTDAARQYSGQGWQ